MLDKLQHADWGVVNLAGIYERCGNMRGGCYLGSKQKAFCPSFTNELRISDAAGCSTVLTLKKEGK